MRQLSKPVRLAGVMLCVLALIGSGCSGGAADRPPPTVAPAGPAVSPIVETTPAGFIRNFRAGGTAALFDGRTSSLVVLDDNSMTVFRMTSNEDRTIALPRPGTGLAADAGGYAYISSRGGYFRANVATGEVVAVTVQGHADTDFTAIARRDDGKLVLGSADGAVYTLGSETDVAAEVHIFARVDALVTQGDTTVVLDRGQTSLTTIDASGSRAAHALRAGEGATTLAADPLGRVLVADTRGEGLLVFSVDPLILRQRYPVRQAPYGVAGSRRLAWVSLTAANVVVGYDLATGIPVEKVRYPTVRQPNVLAFDDASGTLYVVSGSGDGLQVIEHAERPQ